MVGQYYYDNDDGRRWPRVAMVSAAALLIAGAGFWVMTKDDAGGPGARSLAQPSSTAPSVRAPTTAGSAAPVAPRAEPATAGAATTVPGRAAGPGPTATPTTTGVAPAVQIAAGPVPGAGYPTSADGTPLPVIVTYDTDVITITGFVPSEAAKERLGTLAVANSKTDARLQNQLVVNPSVPIGVGVRVIELDSVRFPEGSSEILPAHATELERVAAVMAALPNVSVLVIGHADQRGDAAANFAVSAERAAAVVDFLTYLGVSPTRLSSRAVGEADLLTLGDDDTALALNRRTEFILYGVLAE